MELKIRICKDKQKPIIATYIINKKNVDLFVESLSHDLGERGFYIDEVFEK